MSLRNRYGGGGATLGWQVRNQITAEQRIISRPNRIFDNLVLAESV
jgi:hypothetical protein